MPSAYFMGVRDFFPDDTFPNRDHDAIEVEAAGVTMGAPTAAKADDPVVPGQEIYNPLVMSGPDAFSVWRSKTGA